MLGPVVGQMIYSITNYDFGLTFFIFAALITPFMLLAAFLLPNSLNKRQGVQAASVPHGEGGIMPKEGSPQETNYNYAYSQIFTNFRAVLSLLSAVIILILTLFYDGIISPRFVKIGISKDVIGKIGLALNFN